MGLECEPLSFKFHPPKALQPPWSGTGWVYTYICLYVIIDRNTWLIIVMVHGWQSHGTYLLNDWGITVRDISHFFASTPAACWGSASLQWSNSASRIPKSLWGTPWKQWSIPMKCISNNLTALRNYSGCIRPGGIGMRTHAYIGLNGESVQLWRNMALRMELSDLRRTPHN